MQCQHTHALHTALPAWTPRALIPAPPQVLLQLVAENNLVMTDLISKLGLHERYDIAWKHVRYSNIWEFLRAELEMDQVCVGR